MEEERLTHQRPVQRAKCARFRAGQSFVLAQSLSSVWWQRVGRSGRSSGPRGLRTRGKSGHHRAACRAQASGVFGESRGNGKCHRKQTARRQRWVRVKRRGKSPPLRPQGRRHDKPHAVQDITGGRAARSQPRFGGGMTPGNSRILREQGLDREIPQTNDHTHGSQGPGRTESGL